MEKRSRSQTSELTHKPAYPKQRAAIACEVCRSRKSKCDGATPRCGFCENVGAECNYVARSEKNNEDRSDSAGGGGSSSSTTARLAALEAEVLQLRRTVSDIQVAHQQLQQSPTNLVDLGVEGVGVRHHDHRCSEAGESRQQGIMGAQIDFDMTSYLTDLESDTPAPSILSSNAHPAELFDMHLMTAFFEHVHQWFPIFDQRSFEAQYLLAATRPLLPSPRCCVFLLVSAIGAQVLSIQNGTCEGHSLYALHAFQMAHVAMSDHELIGIQALILYAIYLLLCFEPLRAYGYLTAASHKIQSVYRRSQGRNMVNTELYRRAFYAVYIMERELIVQLDVVKSGISTLHEDVSLPSGTFENGNTDNETIVFFLADIAMNKIMERSHRNLTTNLIHHRNEVHFARILAEEMAFQVSEWRRHLPANMAFSDEGMCSTDLSLYLQLQYNAQMCGTYWHALHRAIVMKDRSREIVAASQQCLDAFCLFIASAANFLSKPSFLAHISMTLASVFVMSLVLLQSREGQLPNDTGPLEESFGRAIKVLDGYGSIYPTVRHWADILRRKVMRANRDAKIIFA
jgi:hypothetical protein